MGGPSESNRAGSRRCVHCTVSEFPLMYDDLPAESDMNTNPSRGYLHEDWNRQRPAYVPVPARSDASILVSRVIMMAAEAVKTLGK